MQTSSLTQQTQAAALSFSETLASRSALQWRALDGSSAGSSTQSATVPADTVSLGTAARAAGARGTGDDDMQSLLGLMQGILQQVLGVPFATVTALPGADKNAVQGAATQAQTPAPLDTLTASILSALGQSPDAAKSGGSPNSLLAALKNMGQSVASDAMNLYQSLAAQSQSQVNDFMSQTAARGGSGSYSSQISVQETESFRFSAQGKVTTAAGQSFEFSLEIELQASISITSTQSGTFGSQGSQALTLGQQAGSFSGASVGYSLQSLLQTASSTSAQREETERSKTDSRPAASAREPAASPFATALARLDLWPAATEGKARGHHRQLAALLQALPQPETVAGKKDKKHDKDQGEDTTGRASDAGAVTTA